MIPYMPKTVCTDCATQVSRDGMDKSYALSLVVHHGVREGFNDTVYRMLVKSKF